MPMSENILKAIHDGDHSTVKRLLHTDRSLATLKIREPRLYQSKIVHWIYAGDTLLHLAAAGYRVEIVHLLLAAGADPNSCYNHRKSGPLHYAADTCLTSPSWNSRKQVETIRCLLKAGARINAQDKNGATPLHRAVRTRGLAAVKYLLKAGVIRCRKTSPVRPRFILRSKIPVEAGVVLPKPNPRRDRSSRNSCLLVWIRVLKMGKGRQFSIVPAVI